MSPEAFPLRLSDATGVPYYRQIVDQVSHLVRSGQLPAGTQLPSVRELASQLLVSLITIRRSYADLENAGLIIRRQGHGTFVAEEVTMASKEQALKQTRNHLAQAVTHALQMGLDSAAVREIFDEVLEKGGEDE